MQRVVVVNVATATLGATTTAFTTTGEDLNMMVDIPTGGGSLTRVGRQGTTVYRFC